MAGVATAPAASAFDALGFYAPGADEALLEDLRAASLLVAAKTAGTHDPQEVLASANADYGRLVGALYSEGRFGGVINILIDGREAAEIPPLNPPKTISTIKVTIDVGPQYRFSRARIEPQAPNTEVDPAFAVGEPARTPVIRDAVATVVDGWRNVGNAKAKVGSQKVVANHDDDAVGVDVGIAPGPVVRFGDLILKGGDSVREDRLRKIAGLPVGTVYDPTELEKVEKRLRRTGVFRSVAVTEAETLGAGDTMDITAVLDEQKPRRIGAGAVFSSTEGAKITAFWMHRNLLGGAERLRIEGEVANIGGSTGGGLDYSLGVRIDRPATPKADIDAFALARVERIDEEEYTSDRATIGLGFTRYATDELTLEGGLSYQFSKDKDATGTREYHQLLLPLKATYDSRDMPLDAKKGYFADITATPFVGVSGSDSGLRATFDTRAYLAFGKQENIVLAGRLQGGSIMGASLTGVPNDDRFYSGGGGTVRGQEYQSLGIQLTPDFLSGGRSFAVFSGEVRAQVREKIGLVAFADFGIVGEDSFPDSDSATHAGAGIGLRYLTPIGPIRLDLAAPVGGRGSGYQVYVGIGQSF